MQDIIRFEYYKYGAQKGIVTQMPKKEIQIFQKGKRRKRKKCGSTMEEEWRREKNNNSLGWASTAL
jgi:hypothetical protein